MDDAVTEPLPSLVALLREDLRYNRAKVSSAGFHAVAVHRLAARLDAVPGPLRPLAALVVAGARLLVVNVYGIEIPPTARLGRRVVIGRGGIVVHPAAEIGDDCNIRHNVTLAGSSDDAKGPRIGRGVELGTGVVVVGGVTVGDGARVGPNVVITTDIPAGAFAVVEPPRVIRPPAPPATGDAPPLTDRVHGS